MVHEFVRGGGGLLLIGDHTNVFGSTSHLNEICEPLRFPIPRRRAVRSRRGFPPGDRRAAVAGRRFWHGMDVLQAARAVLDPADLAGHPHRLSGRALEVGAGDLLGEQLLSRRRTTIRR